MSYPSSAHLQTFLQASNLITSPPEFLETLLDLDVAIQSAISEFEEAVKWYPFLGTSQTRFYDYPSDGLLLLDSGLLTLTSLKVSGTLLTLNSNFYLIPRNASLGGRPVTAIEFNAHYFSIEKSAIEIVGTFGRFLTCPKDVFNAILAKASAILTSQIQNNITDGLMEWSEAGAQEMYGVDPLGKIRDAWLKIFDDTVIRYKRVQII